MEETAVEADVIQASNSDRVLSCVAQAAHLNTTQVRPEQRLWEDLALDVVDVIILTYQLERELCITIPHGELRKARTVSDLISTVERLVAPYSA